MQVASFGCKDFQFQTSVGAQLLNQDTRSSNLYSFHILHHFASFKFAWLIKSDQRCVLHVCDFLEVSFAWVQTRQSLGLRLHNYI